MFNQKPENRIQQSENKKKEVREKFLAELAKKQKKEGNEQKKTHETSNSIVQALKKQKKQDQKTIHELRGKIEVYQSERIHVAEELKQSKQKSYEKQIEIEQLTDHIDLLQAQLQQCEEEKKEAMNALSKKENDQTLTQLKKDQRKIIQSNQHLKEQLKKLKASHQQTKNQLKKAESLTREDFKKEIQELKRLLNERDIQLVSYQQKLENNRENIHVEETVKTLIRRIDDEPIGSYGQVDELYECVLGKRKQKKKLISASQKREAPSFEEPRPGEVIQLGYVLEKDGHWYFYDLDHQITSLTETKMSLENEQPVKVSIYNKNATVIQAYESGRVWEDVQKAVLKEKPKNTKEYLPIGSFKVLIVGSQYLTYYQRRLSRHGLETLIHNPFEESYDRLDAKINQADLTIVCTSHVSHAVLDHMDTSLPTVELIEKDTEDKLVARVRYAGIQLGLI